jgi:hypothetical protein
VNMTIIWLAIWIFIILSIVLQIKAGIKTKYKEQDSTVKEFPSANHLYFENWRSLVRDARRKSFLLAKFLILIMFSIAAGLTFFLYVFIPTSIIAVYIYYRIWRVPNDYWKEMELLNRVSTNKTIK